MSSLRPLHGGCHCGRNHYTIDLPENGADIARVLFDTDPRQRFFQASPLAAFLRVPLSWYRSSTSAFFPDEVSSAIRRTYTHPSQQHTKRGFCGFCGTPLSYWSEDPPSEADFIRLTLGSLDSRDLGDLEEMGLIPGSEDGEEEEKTEGEMVGEEGRQTDSGGDEDGGRRLAVRETYGLPWFNSMLDGSRLGRVGNVRTSRGGGQSRDGRVRYEWEVVEYVASDEDDDNGAAGGLQVAAPGGGHPSPTKRLKQDDSEGSAQTASAQRR